VVESLRVELCALEHRIDAATGSMRLDVGKEVREAMGELRKDLARVESALRERIEQKERTMAENLEAETQLLRRRLEQVADGISERRGQGDEMAAVYTALDELRQNVLTLQSASEERPRPSAVATDWETELGRLRDQVKELATHQVREAASVAHLTEIRRAIEELRSELGCVRQSVAERPLPLASPAGDLEVRVKSLQEKVEELTREQGKEAASADYLVAVSAAIEHLRGDLARVESTLEERLEVRMRSAAAERDAELRRLREKIEEMTGVRSAIDSLRLQLGRTESAVGDRIEARIRSATQVWEAQAESLRAGMQELAVVQRHTLARSAAASLQTALATCARVAEELSDRLAALAERASVARADVSRTLRSRLADILESALRRVSALLP
jgi:myosin heavy subunit